MIYVDSCGGNLLMNVGPTGDGRIAPIFEERLRQFGSWMGVNDEAVYATRPWRYQNDTMTPYVWYALCIFCFRSSFLIVVEAQVPFLEEWSCHHLELVKLYLGQLSLWSRTHLRILFSIFL